MSSLQVLRSLVTERLTAAAEEILVLVERVLLEREEGLVLRYRPDHVKRSPDREPPQSRGIPDAQQLHGFSLQQQPRDEHPELPAIKQEQGAEPGEAWSSPEVQAPQTMVHQDAQGFIYSLECKSEQPPVDSAPPEEAPKVELAHDDILPSTSFEPSDAPPPQFSLPADPPPAACEDADSASCRCRVCGMMFSYRGSLVNHAEIHGDDERCLCGVCGVPLPDRENLVEHLRTHVRVHVCQFCGKSFRGKVELAVHTRCHTGEKPFSCRVCGKCFSRKGNMAIHMRTHTGEKPYRCAVCGKCFTMTSSMIRHARTHSGEKPTAATAASRASPTART
ncbi:zinc finger protein 133-like [Micropterus salmoides]|uniref:zinc finger protein 133-like n=1 Tax=Micropterus salmoides TaxID=27706 RepID=UPI0018EDFBD2|nr:zinc finger protein 133-like [Micropterus salmoides]